MDSTAGLLGFLQGSPSPYHAAHNASAFLASRGCERIEPSTPLPATPGSYHVVLGGTVVAWSGDPARTAHGGGLRIVAAHTDSPNLRIKPHPDRRSGNAKQLGVEVYGSPLLNSWLDRDLGISGRVEIIEDGAPAQKLLCCDRPLLRIPQLAIHLDREVNTKGLLLNPQSHLDPIWGIGTTDLPSFRGWLAQQLGTEPDQVLAWDLMAHDVAPPTLAGPDGSLISSGRIDNLVSCWAILRAFAAPDGSGHDRSGQVRVMALFDHEEVGSTSSSGANSSTLGSLLERIVLAGGGDREAFLRCLSSSACISTDGAHATNPNYPERYDPSHTVELNAGPVVKHNANMRYATEPAGAGAFMLACREAQIPLQSFVSRNDIPCGSTIGPSLSSQLGVRTTDVGVAQLSMHSAREVCGALDPPMLARALSLHLDAP